MTAANWKTNEVNKSNLDSGVAAVFVCGHRGKAPRAFVDLFCAEAVFSYTVLAKILAGVVEMSTYASVL